MKYLKYILFIFLGILIIPVFSLLILSFKTTGGESFKWYSEIIRNDSFVSAFLNSFTMSVIVGLLSVICCSVISLTYFDRKIRLAVILVILMLGLMPPDIISISINKLVQCTGFHRANFFFLYFGLLLYCLPFGIIILWIRYYFIGRDLITAGEDLGLSRQSMVLKIVLPLSKTSLISVFLFSFLLVFNEYPRTFYLSGSAEFLSEFLNGKLSSGTDNSIYAGGSIAILISILIILGYGFSSYYAKLKKAKVSSLSGRSINAESN